MKGRFKNSFVLLAVVILLFICLSLSFSSAGIVDDFQDWVSDLELGSYFQGGVSSGYTLVSSDGVRLSPGDRECLFASSSEQIKFKWCTSSFCLSGVIRNGDSHCFGFPNDGINLNWEIYVKSDSNDDGSHKTQNYRCILHSWEVGGYYDEAYSDALGVKWCSDSRDSAYEDFDGRFYCARSPLDSWCTDRKDARWCMYEQTGDAGRVSRGPCENTDYSEGIEIAILDDGSYCCIDRWKNNDIGVGESFFIAVRNPNYPIYGDNWFSKGVVQPLFGTTDTGEVVSGFIQNFFGDVWFWIKIILAVVLVLFILVIISRFLGVF